MYDLLLQILELDKTGLVASRTVLGRKRSNHLLAADRHSPGSAIRTRACSQSGSS